MRFVSFAFASFFMVVISALITGCATFGGGQVSGVNWALAKNGGRVTAFSEEPDHPASALIDGVTSSDEWDKGGGWQAPIVLVQETSRSVRAAREEQERNWVIIELPQPVTVNEVRIYTIDSEKYPARDYGVRDLLVQYELQTASKEMIWANVKRPGKSIGDQDNVVRGNVSGVVRVRFEPVTTQRIRLLIFSTNDLARAESAKSKEGIIRLTEVEVYGLGKQKSRDQLEELFER